MRLTLLTAVLLAVPVVAADPEIKLEQTNLDGLLKAIEAHKGKIVVVDVWANFCQPCKEKFPHIVKLHNDLAEQGVVFISLSVDDLDDKAASLEFLKKNKATFQNFILADKDRNEEAGDKKLYHSIPPIVHVFDRTGAKVKTYESKKESAALDGLLKELLAKK